MSYRRLTKKKKSAHFLPMLITYGPTKLTQLDVRDYTPHGVPMSITSRRFKVYV